MTLTARLARLERARQPKGAAALALTLAPDLEARVEAARLAGTFPQSLSSPDLRAIVDAADKAEAQA